MRIAVRAALTVAQGLGRLWVGGAANRPDVRVAIRGLGARDLGLGTVLA